MAIAGYRLYSLPQDATDVVKWRDHVVAVLHSTAVAIYNRRHTAFPLPGTSWISQIGNVPDETQPSHHSQGQPGQG
eukprot:1107478-Pyramimonas_sp.AAC.1